FSGGRGFCCRIAVARDEAFCFSYAETLESLRDAGAELVFFSPVHDAALPGGAGGLYLPGGYPELYAGQLSQNAAMRRAVRRAVEAGLPTVAECGGFLYLGRSLEGEDGAVHPMAGALPGAGVRRQKLVRFGYAQLTARADSLLLRAGETVPVHEFHYWDSTENGAAFNAQKPATGRSWTCGFAGPALYAAFPHLYFAGRPQLAERFVRAAAAFQSGR
ncbi:MAG: cobyrinic acid a,c-diamide synthase, partial [Ruthenibacterium sp.]|nr:cobyrinic acid a,c-diamide synthase [Ruthenibacterium sp.]